MIPGILASLTPESVEKFIGIECYVTRGSGIGGVIKSSPEDFQTWEQLVDGLDARSMYESWRGLREGFGDQLLAVMWKRGVDTIRACTILARQLGIRPAQIGVCGIKDKVSVSWQFITLPAWSMRSEGVDVGGVIKVLPIMHVGWRINSERLARNMFEIVIRGPSGGAEAVQTILEELRLKGAPNFYGHQRFGISRPITPIVGRLMIEGRIEEAVKTFLTEYSPLESNENRMARMKLLEDFNPERALEYFPKTLRYERAILRYLARRPGDYLGALRSIPLRLRRLLVESVSALIFNKALSRVIAEDLLDVVEAGDLVVRLDTFGRPEPGRPIMVSEANLQQVVRLIARGKLAVALPAPGYLSPIPRSRKGEILLDILDEMGLELNAFRLKTCPEASTRGSLRPIKITKWSCKISEMDNTSIKLNIELPPGSYATILLREIMKPKSPLAFIGGGNTNDLPPA
ncbi:MAG: tRNA pseudouridine(13) synthase TruD [Thaumarchaeota archaeon]|jgi:tRNA pseudouridine13 synthase|nr:tRNA pseudouridine(13) synthase TruD [Candidatus Wolframiiraptor allenii]